MAVIIAGIFPSRDQADAAVRELRDRGFDASDVGLVLRGGVARAAGTAPAPGPNTFAWIPDHRNVTLSGIGSVLAAGTIADCLNRQQPSSGQGSLTDALTCLGIERPHAEWYGQEVREGYNLVTVRTENRASDARSIMEQLGSIEVPSAERTPSEAPISPGSATRAQEQLTRSELQSVEPGWAICGSDGKQVGKVDEVGQNYLLMKKGFLFPKDVYIPFSAVERVQPNQVVLNVPDDQVAKEHWEHPPAALSATGAAGAGGAVAAAGAAATGANAPTGSAPKGVGDLSQVKQGFDVCTSDGRKIGTVRDTSAQCMHVLCCSNLFVPPSRVERVTDDSVVLNVSEADLGNYDWSSCHPSHQAQYQPGGPGYSGLSPQEHEGGVQIPIESGDE
ncbi:MAG TPA: DUF2171 domain-containing protein [Chloroflexota bacterium]|nr:DUF2171 domain-containing protein [Chloroflexota bacterium]